MVSRRIVRGAVASAVVALVGAGFYGLNGPAAQQPGPQSTPQAATPAPQPPLVAVSRPVQREIVEWDEYTGRFDAVDTVEIRARVSGYLTEVHFKDGQRVSKGDLLYSIDERPFQRALEQVQAELAQAKTKVENSSLDVERGKPLVERRIMSEKVFDDRANALREAQAAMRVAEAKIKTAELDLFFTKITAPISGRISKSNISAGNWISAGSASNSTVMTSLVSEDPIQIYFDISENNWIKYRRMVESGQKGGAAQQGAAIELALPDEKGYPHRGTVDFIDNRLDQGTGTLRARALVDNKAGTFSAGMFARVRVAGSPKYLALLLPDEAIGTDQTNKFVYVVAEDGTVARKNIGFGPLVEGLRLVRAGIGTEDWVVTKGLQRARPGQKVTPKRETLQISNAGDASQPPTRTARPE